MIALFKIREITSAKSFRCPECRFPMCSQECAEGPLHSLNECKVFHKAEINAEIKIDESEDEDKFSPAPEYAAITTIRAFLLKGPSVSLKL